DRQASQELQARQDQAEALQDFAQYFRGLPDHRAEQAARHSGGPGARDGGVRPAATGLEAIELVSKPVRGATAGSSRSVNRRKALLGKPAVAHRFSIPEPARAPPFRLILSGPGLLFRGEQPRP